MYQTSVVKAFAEVGNILRSYLEKKNSTTAFSKEEKKLEEAVNLAMLDNHWFTPDSVSYSLRALAEMLQQKALDKWLQNYTIPENNDKARSVGVVTAGNIPLVGFHDFLCVMVSGHHFIGKLSSRDDHLLKALAGILVQILPELSTRIRFTDNLLKDYEAVIATGSNNSARHFEYYFRNVPHIIRKNRNGIALLDGSENPDELRSLADDIFRYFGLGCRNVSKIYVPMNYDFDPFFRALEGWKEIRNHHHYVNNYEYNRAIFLVNQVPHLDNGFLLVREERMLPSPVAVLHYEKYPSVQQLSDELKKREQEIQCIVSLQGKPWCGIPFGTSQNPGPADYADGVDTLAFLLQLYN